MGRVACLMSAVLFSGVSSAMTLPETVTKLTGSTGGLCVQIGLLDGGALAKEFAGTGAWLVHGFDTNPQHVFQATQQLRETAQYGLAVFEARVALDTLPFAENLVNLVVLSDVPEGLEPAEIDRILRPLGRIVVPTSLLSVEHVVQAGFVRTQTFVYAGQECVIAQKPWPDTMDGWPHPRHSPTNNPVSSDEVVGPPRRIRWVTGPYEYYPYMISSRGVNFYGATIARDGFNGLPMWQKPLGQGWSPHPSIKFQRGSMHPVAVDDRLYAVENGVLSAMSIETGEVLQKYPDAGDAQQLLVEGAYMVSLCPAEIRVLNVSDGKLRWARKAHDPGCVVIAEGAVFYGDGSRRLGDARLFRRVDIATGKQVWHVQEAEWTSQVALLKDLGRAVWCVYHDGVLVFEVSTYSDWREGSCMFVLDAKDGKALWGREAKPAGHHSQVRAIGIDGLIYIQEGTRVTGLDARTGERKCEFATIPNHCFPAMATESHFLTGEMSVTDLATFETDTNRITKANCSRYGGVWPANGLLYTIPKWCVCWPMLDGFTALAPERDREVTLDFPLITYAPAPKASPAADNEWPCYRQDASRSGAIDMSVSAELDMLWEATLGERPDSRFKGDWIGNPVIKGPLTAPTIADGLVFVSRPDAQEIVALEADSGEVRWRRGTKGRVDGPPTIYNGLAIYGTRNGYVTALMARNGAPVWQRRLAPHEERIVSHGQVESPWPAAGSVLISNGVAYVMAGRQYLADGGVGVFALVPETGETKWLRVVNELPEHHYYASNSIEFDATDLLVREADHVAMSRWEFDPETGAMEVFEKIGFGHFKTAGAEVGVIAERGYWTYGARVGRRVETRGLTRPLAVYSSDTLYACTEEKDGVFRRDFTEASIAAFDREWYNNRLVEPARAKMEGETSRSIRLMNETTWVNESVDEKGIAAMALVGDKLLVVGQEGGLKVIATSDGSVIMEHALPAPIWDGMAAAYGRVFVATADGRVICLGD